MVSKPETAEPKLIAFDSIHPVLEVLSYCARRAAGKPISLEIQRMRQEYPESRESINCNFAPLEELEGRLDEVAKDLNEERFRFFFEELGEGNRSGPAANLANVILWPDMTAFDDLGEQMPEQERNRSYRQRSFGSFSEYCRRLSGLPQSDILYRARMTFFVQNERQERDECDTFDKFYDYIWSYPTTDANRYQIMGTVRYFAQYLQELEQMLAPMVQVILDAEPIYHTLLERFYQSCMGKRPNEVFTERPHPAYYAQSDLFQIFPRLLSFEDPFLLVYQQAEDRPICSCIEVGVLYHTAQEYKQRDISLKDISLYMKALADPVRLQILKILREQDEVYVQELTEQLGLSFTTLSHHMSKLMTTSLVVSERRGNYIYYRANTDFLRWIKSRLDEVMLGEENQ